MAVGVYFGLLCLHFIEQKSQSSLLGVTKNLIKRVYEHKQGFVEGFTKKYNVKRLVYYEVLDNIENAIAREKQLKGGNRRTKELLVESKNPEWDDYTQKSPNRSIEIASSKTRRNDGKGLLVNCWLLEDAT